MKNKIAVFSDSHGNISNIISAIKSFSPDIIFHLGDYYTDARILEENAGSIPLHSVYGNCDFPVAGKDIEELTVGAFKIILCHGHKFKVKSSLRELKIKGAEQKADIILYGHTHVAYAENDEGRFYLNPGSISGRGECTFAILEIENRRMECTHYEKEKNGEWCEKSSEFMQK